ncbi:MULTISPECIES: DUF423 domain-containing protein [unclassified Arenibacter]|uniref:DUF423 domain-containing protein n=1 Tax=unclassified Arenibacter TaxID=2615047 RepID=UPI000E346877|nr:MULTISPECIES: DUF423 domain-containing protein [unclassified Arenibacter]MCM4162140.1 DUF423 domain-containing protein [Arenibacter sp. A80]RFT57755.1 DUF423 domain-containing protein [Arenibacter sp. P308M17]
MVLIAHIMGSLYGLLAVVFGAFGAHALKKTLNEQQLKSFETGVKYQMYHAILLLVLGFNLNLDSSLERYMVYSFIIGTFLFSFSIYGLSISAAKGRKIKALGPITPLGGLLLVLGWALLLYSFVQNLV